MDQINNYIQAIDPKWQQAYRKIFDVFHEGLTDDFAIEMQNNLPTFVVPLAKFPEGYHCTPGQALPFISIGAKKNHIAIYHMGIYANPDLLHWFQEEYAKSVPSKLNMGKSCIRFTNPKTIPYSLLSQLATKMTAQDWINLYKKII